MTDLDVEREAVDHALGEAGIGWDEWPDCVVTAPWGARTSLSALLLLLAMPPNRTVRSDGRIALGEQGDRALDRLGRRKLPWDAGTAALAVEVVSSRGTFDAVRVRVALRGAETVCASGLADVTLLEALTGCRTWLDDITADLWHLPQMRLLVRQALVAATPPEVLDLSLLSDGDGWGASARELAAAHSHDDVVELVRRLSELGSRKTSQKWLTGVAAALEKPAARSLLQGWLELAARTPVVTLTSTDGPDQEVLFVAANGDLVRAAALAARQLPHEDWVPPLMGVLARRGASLSLKVAGAAIDTLVVRDTPSDVLVLEGLFADLTRRDLVKRIGESLGRKSEADARAEELRRVKAAAVRRKADPAPRLVRAELDALIRRHLGPELRRLGFSQGGWTWRRMHSDRVDVIAFGASDGSLSLSYGARFDAVHPAGEPHPVDRSKAHDRDLDIRLVEDCDVSDSGLVSAARRLETTIVPFLDAMGRYEFARSYLEHGAGAPQASRAFDNPQSPSAVGTVGLLALAAKDRSTAIGQLGKRLEFEKSDRAYLDAEIQAGRVSFWSRQLKKAQSLPGEEKPRSSRDQS